MNRGPLADCRKGCRRFSLYHPTGEGRGEGSFSPPAFTSWKLFLGAVLLMLGVQWTAAQSTAFTYQGRLSDNGRPANGDYDFQFKLHKTEDGDAVDLLTNAPVAVSNGLFSVSLDFTQVVFGSTNYWLELGVRTNGSVAPYITLSPWQPLTPSPLAIHAYHAGAALTADTATTANGVAANTITGMGIQDSTITAAKIDRGQVLKSLNGLSDVVTLTAGANVSITPSGNTLTLAASAASGWSLSGNADTASADYIGTSDNQPLLLKANGDQILRLEPNSYAPNLIGGSANNFVAPGVEGATIVGGGTLTRSGGVYSNAIAADYAVIGGGLGNRIALNSFASTIAGGRENLLQFGAYRSAIGGGLANIITTNAYESTIGGGSQNTAESNAATVGGGQLNHARGSSSAVGGGYNNNASGGSTTISGGANNQIIADASTIGGGTANTIGLGSVESVIGGGNANRIQTNANDSFIGAGNFNRIETHHSVIGGGYGNDIQEGAYFSAIGGGGPNTILPGAFASTISGGAYNEVSGIYGTISGGSGNKTGGEYATVCGGRDNFARGPYSFAAGRHSEAYFNGSFVWADSQDEAFSDINIDSVRFRCRGGVQFYSGSLANVAVAWTPGSGSWSFSSDRNLKDRLKTVDPQEVLERVSKLSITEWSYKDLPQRHIGAMAQDFHALFPLNADDKSLNDADLHGVELAAIQGLNQKVEEKDAELKALQHRLSRLEALISKSTLEKANP